MPAIVRKNLELSAMSHHRLCKRTYAVTLIRAHNHNRNARLLSATVKVVEVHATSGIPIKLLLHEAVSLAFELTILNSHIQFLFLTLKPTALCREGSIRSEERAFV